MAYTDEDLIKAALLDDDDPSDKPDQNAAKPDNPDKPQENPKPANKPETPEANKPEDDDPAHTKKGAQEDEDEDPKNDPKPDPKNAKPSEGEEDDDKKLTRKEKREARHQRYIEQIKRDQEQRPNPRQQLFQGDPNYKPIDYTSAPDFDAKELAEDRAKYGQTNFARGAETERYYAEQENFWTRTEYEAKLLEQDPKFNFLDDAKEEYDPEKTEELNSLYLELVGFNPQTRTVRRTDISFEKFVKAEVGRMEKWAEERQEQTVENLAAQRGMGGIRPSGSSSRGLGRLKPGDISKMSQEDFEKNEAEIDRQILSALE